MIARCCTIACWPRTCLRRAASLRLCPVSICPRLPRTETPPCAYVTCLSICSSGADAAVGGGVCAAEHAVCDLQQAS